DKGSAAVFEVAVQSEYFVATWSIFAPGAGGFGGERGPAGPKPQQTAADARLTLPTSPTQAALYRLLGDRHHMHIDPAAAAAAGQPRPFLHGLCTLAAATLPLAHRMQSHSADLRELEGRFAAPVFPGDRLDIELWTAEPGAARFAVTGAERAVISGGRARFSHG
ncbi:MAG: MaoC/PaaZ C-terminal domain-containing protein, partial [Nocardioidaceae bacterium]